MAEASGDTTRSRSSKQLEFILYSEENGVVIGASNIINSINWSADLYYFHNEEKIPYQKDIVTANDCVKNVFPISICCGSFLKNERRVIVGNDSGMLAIYSITHRESTTSEHSADNEEGFGIYNDICMSMDDRSILSLHVAQDGKQVVTAGMDYSIKLWDLETFIPITTYSMAHSNYVTCVRYKDNETENGVTDRYFVSTSLDGNCTLWDRRQQYPALTLAKHEYTGYTAVEWLQSGEKIVVGCENGEIAIVDVRYTKDKDTLAVKNENSHNYINKISSYCRNNENYVAICEESNALKVCKYEDNSLKEIYKDTSHCDYVKDAVWIQKPDKEMLLSCSWDSTVVQHNPFKSLEKAKTDLS